MKKTIKALLTVYITAMASVSLTYAQTIKKDFNFNDKDTESFAASTKRFNEPINSVGYSKNLSAINAKAFKWFQKKFKGIQANYWDKIEGGYLAMVEADGVKTRVYFDEAGRFINSVKYYSVDLLSPEIKKLVKDAYSSYSIFTVQEVYSTEHNLTVYVIVLEGMTNWLNITVSGGEIYVLNNYSK